MSNRTLTGAIVSPDREFRDSLKAALQERGSNVRLQAEIAVPFSEIDADQLQLLRSTNPELVFLDLSSDPALGIQLSEFLSEANAASHIVGFGPVLSADLLMEAMRAGIGEYLPKPLSADSVAAALERLGRKIVRATPDAKEAREPGDLLCAHSTKGGTGCTTFATNLAVQLHRLTGKATLLLDLDDELGDTAVLLGLQPRFNFVDVARNLHRMDPELLGSYVERHESGVHLLSAPVQLERSDPLPADVIRKLLLLVRQQYDYVVVDTNSLSAAAKAALDQARTIFVISNPDLLALRNATLSMALLQRIAGAGGDRLRVVVNRFNEEGQIGLDEIRRTLGDLVYTTLPTDEAVIESVNAGKPVVDKEKSPFARELRSLVADIAGLRSTTAGRKNPFQSIRKLFTRSQEAVAHG